MINQDDINKIKADLDKDEAKKLAAQAISNRQKFCWAGVATFAAIPVLISLSCLGIIHGGAAAAFAGFSAVATILLFFIGTKDFSDFPFNL